MKFRPQFTLRIFFLVAILLTLAVSHYFTSLRLGGTQRQLEDLRNEVGYLTISDPKCVHVIQVPTVDDYTFRWRVYLPPGRTIWANVKISDQLPPVGFPAEQTGQFSHNLSFGKHSDEFILTVAARQDGSGMWKVVCYSDDTTGTERSGIGLMHGQGDALRRGNWICVETGKGITESAPPGEPFVLLRWGKPKSSIIASEFYPSDGIMVWIEEKK